MALIFDCSVREHPSAVIVHLNWVCIFDGPGRGGTFNVFAVLSAMGVAGVLGAALGSIPPVWLSSGQEHWQS